MINDSVTDFSLLIKECKELMKVVPEIRAIIELLLFAEGYSKNLHVPLGIMDDFLDTLEKDMNIFLRHIEKMWCCHILKTLG